MCPKLDTSTWKSRLGSGSGHIRDITVQRRGVFALPADLRRRLHLDEPGAQVEITEREDGVIELRAALPVPVTVEDGPRGAMHHALPKQETISRHMIKFQPADAVSSRHLRPRRIDVEKTCPA